MKSQPKPRSPFSVKREIHMRKILSLLLLLLAAAVPAQAESVSFTDDLGRPVSVEDPQRVAVLIGSFADVYCLAGGKDRITAAAGDTFTLFDLGLPEDTANLGAVKEPNIEALLASNPDFVIGSTKTAADVKIADMMDEIGVPTALFNISSFEDYLRMLDICTRITGRPDLFEQNGLSVQAQVEAAKARTAGMVPPTVLYVRASGSSCKVKNSKNTVLGEMLADLGCVNIADSETGLLEELSMETILMTDPDYIFAVLQGSDPQKARQSIEKALLSNPAWQQLTAVREGRFFFMDQQLYNLKPNARWGEAYEKLADILVPAP